LALFVLPNIDIFTLPGYGKDLIYSNLTLKIVLFALFFPNLLLVALGVIPYASHTWSIGTEEQYYLIWPVLLKYVFKKYRIGVMLAIVAFYLLMDEVLSMSYFDSIPYKTIIQGFWATFNIDCMAIGGLFAILLFRNYKILKVLMNKYFFYFVLLTVVVLIIKGVCVPKFHNEFYALLFGIIILNFAANKSIRISLENRFMNYLGNISYGLYMYHPIGIVLSLYIASTIGILSNWLLLPMAVLITVSISAFSYKYFESFFLKFKDKFSNILSGVKNRL
jgi:peptidoglycan/LPS O-acetylase OafA/YrhL